MCHLRSEKVRRLPSKQVSAPQNAALMLRQQHPTPEYVFLSTNTAVQNISYLKFAVITRKDGMRGVYKLHFFPITFLKQRSILV